MRSVAVLGLALAVPLALVSAQQLTATERAEAVATIWAEARYNFASWDRVRADWDSALTANLKLAAQVQSDDRDRPGRLREVVEWSAPLPVESRLH